MQISVYFENNKLFTESQFGFRSNMSTTLAINKLTEIINDGFEKGEYIYSKFLDLTKAFDCVSHRVLLDKLTYYNFSSDSIQFFNSYLSDRIQTVSYYHNTSTALKVKHGVPQGSVLGPILFLVYINDLPGINATADFVLFADDTTYIQRHKDINSLLSDVTKSVPTLDNWFLTNKLSLNHNKSQEMIFTLRDYKNDDNVNLKDCVKFLGVYLDNKLSWEQHSAYISKKVASNTFLLRNLAMKVSQETLLTAYYGLIDSIISYAIFVWGHSPHSSTVFAAQRRAIRVIANLAYRDDCKSTFKALQILTLPCIYIFQCLLYMKSNTEQYVRHNQTHNYSTRNKENLQLDFLRLTKTRNGANYHAIKFFNILPPSLKILDFNKFKKCIKKFLLNNPYYNINDFLAADFSSFNV